MRIIAPELAQKRADSGNENQADFLFTGEAA